jgi:acyl-CoA synthetase (AMP-forming)/AMP-acid ligase II
MTYRPLQREAAQIRSWLNDQFGREPGDRWSLALQKSGAWILTDRTNKQSQPVDPTSPIWTAMLALTKRAEALRFGGEKLSA